MAEVSRTECPHCNFLLTKPSDSCPRCGVIFAKLSQPQPPPPVKTSHVIVTTGDLRVDYEIICPIYFAVSNKGLFSNQLKQLAKKHGFSSPPRDGAGNDVLNGLAGEWPLGLQDFPLAFAVSVEELKLLTLSKGGDAIVWLRQSIELDTNGFQFFYMQMYGTAARRAGHGAQRDPG
jgi:hypothetical protein